MALTLTDPPFLFPAISLLFLAYTNRYATLASVIRNLNKKNKIDVENRNQQIKSLHLRIILIKYMQAFAALSFIFCLFSMLFLIFSKQHNGEVFFIGSLVAVCISLFICLAEIMLSGQSLKIELDRTHNSDH